MIFHLSVNVGLFTLTLKLIQVVDISVSRSDRIYLSYFQFLILAEYCTLLKHGEWGALVWTPRPSPIPGNIFGLNRPKDKRWWHSRWWLHIFYIFYHSSSTRFGIRSSLEEFTLLRRVFVINTLLSLFFGRKTLPSFSKFSFSAYLCNQSSVVAINTAAYFISATIKLDSLYFHQGTVLVSYKNARNPSKCRWLHI